MFNTIQEAFDATVNHLAKQGRKASISITKNFGDGEVRTTTRCLYKTDDGLTCAVGCHLSEENHARAAGYVGPLNFLIKEKFRHFPEELKIANVNESGLYKFWARMQHAHDNSQSLSHLRRELSSVAGEFFLNDSSIHSIKTWEG